MNLSRNFWLGAVGVVIGGAAAGWLAAAWYVSPQFARFENTWRAQLERVTASTSTPRGIESPEVVPVVRPQATPAYPSAFILRRLSPVVALVRRSGSKPPEEGIAEGERELGAAMGVTADGWLITTTAALNGLRLTDLAVAWQGRARPILKAIRDQSTDVVFLKIEANDLSVAEFVRPEDVAQGMGVWLEPRAKRLHPETIMDMRARAGGETVLSERVTRRLLVSGATGLQWSGGGVWDTQGRLVGLLDTFTPEGWRVIPSAYISGALTLLLSNGEIRHASLGVRSMDLARRVFEQERSALPMQGAWVRGDRVRNLPAVVPNGPAAKVLRDGDVIERIERDILDGAMDLSERLLAYRPGTRVTIYGQRQTKPLEVSVTLGSIITSEILK